MRRALILSLSLFLVAGIAPMGSAGDGALELVRVPVSTIEDAQLLLNSFDETHNHGGGYVELLLHPNDASRLKNLGFTYEVLDRDVRATHAAGLARRGPVIELPGPDRDTYRRLEDYNLEMQELAERRPGLVRLLALPFETLEGRTVYGLEIAADVTRKDGRPTFHVDGVHHAREWPSGEYPMIFAHHLVERFGKDPKITRLLKRVRVVIVPVVNPDGFDYSRSSLVDPPGAASLGPSLLGAEAYWRKNRRSFTGVTVPAVQKNPDAYGVDPNRNYGFEWGASNGSSGNLAMQDYRGDAPFSEPEAANIRSLILSRQTTAVITNHTYGRLVLRPWGHIAEDAPDERVLASVGARMATAMGGYQNIKGLGLYATTGTTDDWAYAATGSLGYTFEHESAFHPPYEESVGKGWRGVMKAFLIGAETAADPARHGLVAGRVVDEGGRPARATLRLVKSFETPLGKGNPTGETTLEEALVSTMVTSADGTFRWHTNPSTRPIVASKGRTESFRLEFRSAGVCSAVRFSLQRGQMRDLGSLRLSGPGSGYAACSKGSE